MENSFIPVKQAAKLLNVSPHYIRKLLREEKLDGERNSETGRWTVNISSLDKFKKSDIYRQDIQTLAKEMKITIKEAVENVEDNFECDLVSYISFPNHPAAMIDQNDCILLDDLLYNLKEVYKKGTSGKKYSRICLFLHSGGGILEAAIKFIDIIRQYSNEYYVIVPIMAKSAATYMVLMADKQYFTSLSELGPVDPLIQSPSNPNFIVPATAIDNFMKYYEQKSENTDTNVTPKGFHPLILKKLEENMDPYLIGAHKTALRFSQTEIEKALKEHAMKNMKDQEKIEEAIREFTIKYESHNYPITYTRLSYFGIGEKIDDENLKSVKTLMSVYQQFMANSNIVKLIGNREENKNITITPLNPMQQIPTRTSL